VRAAKSAFVSVGKAERHWEQLFFRTTLRTVGSTGAPLPPDGYRWVADQLGIDKNTVYKYLQEGALPGLQLGRKWLVSERRLAEFLERVEREIADLQKVARDIREQLADDPGDGPDRAEALRQAEEQEAIAAVLEERRAELQRRLAAS